MTGRSSTPTVAIALGMDRVQGHDDINKGDEGSSASFANDGDDTTNEEDDNLSISSITPTLRRSQAMIVFILLAGLGGGIAFVLLGIQNEKNVADTRFETVARQLSRDIASTVQEYEAAARSVHNVCRRRDTTRQQFREFYEYLTSGGLQFQAAQCVPNVTHDERPAHEQAARDYYTQYYPQSVNYTGFRGFVLDAETNTYVLSPVRDEAPFYFPVDMSEPVVPNAQALGLDTYSHPFQRKEIELALATHKPVLGGRLKLVQETEKNAYTVIMRHPGIPLADETQPQGADYPTAHIPRELGVILIRIPSLLKRRANEQKENIACYLYDITPANTRGVETYLGAAAYDARVVNDTIVTTVRTPPQDMEYQHLLASTPSHRTFQVQIPIANALWTMVVTPIPGDTTYDAPLGQVIFGGIMILFITLTMVMFLAWNMRQVQQIHKAKMQAEAERTMIASLYPENVVKPLLEIQRNKQKAIKEKIKNKGKVFEGKRTDGLNSTNNSTHIHGRGNMGENGVSLSAAGLDPMQGLHTDDRPCESIFGSQPIAHHYPETTILFMDMVGFTAWSRNREPSEVFTLLENTYHSFDVIAKRKRVFKVETVGDCYVAAAGVPEPRSNHAVIMVKFASDCLVKMKALMLQLVPTLGPDTANLTLRIGLHSGPVTGGVLRGEKGRFQLFGDSMNTAARMESNGKQGQIHVSESTAECLLASGKGRWLTPREDKIVAKGIGEMTTYWVKVSAASVGTGISTSGHTPSSTSQCTSDDMGADEDFTEDAAMMQEEIKLEFEISESYPHNGDAGAEDDEFAEAVRRRTQVQPSTLLSAKIAEAWGPSDDEEA